MTLLHRAATAALLFALAALLPPPSTFAQLEYSEDDWQAWPRATQFHAFSSGRNTIYVGSNAGIYRWDRNEQRWLMPWTTEPGSMTAIFLTNVTFVREDPLTLDVYVQARGEWYLRSRGRDRWERIGPPDSIVMGRLARNEPDRVTPDRNMILPFSYDLGLEGQLRYDLEEWGFDGGLTTDYGASVYAWRGFGLGLMDPYSPRVTLHPTGPGASTSMDVSADAIWCTSVLDRDTGWLWERRRNEAHWRFHHPDLTWGLEPGVVHELRIDRAGRAWLATNNGVMVQSPGGEARHMRKQDGLPRDDVLDVVPMGDGAWVGTLFGLAHVSVKDWQVRRPDKESDPLPFSGIFSELEASGDTLLASGPGHLVRKAGSGPWEVIDTPPFTGARSEPTALYVSGSLLMVADSRGLAWRETDDSHWQDIPASLWHGGTPRSIAVHGGFVWLGTDRGLVRYRRRDGQVVTYDREDGLYGYAVHEIHPEGDWLWLGTDAALVKFRWREEGRLE